MLRWSPSEEGIPYDKLRQREEIAFFEQLVLMEDELADNGVCIQSAKVRAMPSGFFCLHRLLLRLDDVVATIHDTRLYHEYGTSRVFHEFTVRSATYDQLRADGKLPKDASQLADENVLAELLPLRSTVNSVIRLE